MRTKSRLNFKGFIQKIVTRPQTHKLSSEEPLGGKDKKISAK